MKRIEFKFIVLISLFFLVSCSGSTYSELQLAAARGQTDRVQVLLDKGGDVNEPNKHGKTPVQLAAASGQVETLRVLAERNANINSQDIDGMTPLMEAAAAGHTKAVQLLVEKGADINVINKYDATALTNAVFFNHIEATKALLAAPKRFEQATVENALLIAAGLGNNEIVNSLLSYGADINARGKNGRTPLMAAVHFEHADTVKLLIKANADVSPQDVDGNTAISIAQDNSNDAILAILRTADSRKQDKLLGTN